MQVLRIGFALALAGCIVFEPKPQQQDAAPRGDAATGDASETLQEAANRVIAAWQKCVSKTDLEVTQFAVTWAELPTMPGQSCSSCHATGAEGFVATADTSLLHSLLTTERPYLAQYLTVDLTGGPASAAMVVNGSAQTGVSQGTPPHAMHPPFDPAPGLAASEELRKAVQARLDAGACAE